MIQSMCSTVSSECCDRGRYFFPPRPLTLWPWLSPDWSFRHWDTTCSLDIIQPRIYQWNYNSHTNTCVRSHSQIAICLRMWLKKCMGGQNGKAQQINFNFEWPYPKCLINYFLCIFSTYDTRGVTLWHFPVLSHILNIVVHVLLKMLVSLENVSVAQCTWPHNHTRPVWIIGFRVWSCSLGRR